VDLNGKRIKLNYFFGKEMYLTYPPDDVSNWLTSLATLKTELTSDLISINL